MIFGQNRFIFQSYTFEREFAAIRLQYRIEHESYVGEFVERIFLPSDIITPEAESSIEKVALHLHIACGLSYWKAFCPEKLIIQSGALSDTALRFWQSVYTEGMGEFYYRNQIDFRNLAHFVSENRPDCQYNLRKNEISEWSNDPLVAFGGGKDSLVSIELLKKYNKKPVLYTLHNTMTHAGIVRLAQATDCPLISVRREIDPTLFSLKKNVKIHDGHIPVSIIYAFVGVLLAEILNKKYIVLSNEKSADEGNVSYLGYTINHQWSKSTKAERLIQSYIASEVSPDIVYFSLLRPYSELAITHAFSSMNKYHQLFSSCNRNFIQVSQGDMKWCGACAKCAFAFIMLAAFLPKQKVIEIFRHDYLDDESLVALYERLLGTGIKPFDCVGTIEEVHVAFLLIAKRNEFLRSRTMQLFTQKYASSIQNHEEMITRVLRENGPHFIPQLYSHIRLHS